MKLIWEELNQHLTRETIIRVSDENKEKPFGYIFDYIKDVYPFVNRVERTELAVALCVKWGLQVFGDTRQVLKFKGYEYGEYADYVIDPVTHAPMLVPTGLEWSPISGNALVWADEDLKEIPLEVAEFSMAIAETFPYKPTAKTRFGDTVFLNILPLEHGNYSVGVFEDSNCIKMVLAFMVHSGIDGDIPDCDCTDYAEVIKFAIRKVFNKKEVLTYFEEKVSENA